MIYEALLVPKEHPTSIREIKRALLTYDKVILIDPTDRDIIPSNAFFSTLIGFPLIGTNMGPVRPMGKSIAFDDIFERTLASCRSATDQGILKVQSTYSRAITHGATMGGVPLGGYPLHPEYVLFLYRNLAANQDVLRKAVAKSGPGLLKELPAAPQLALNGVGDMTINDSALPALEHPSFPSEHRSAITKIARARIGAFIKYAGYCEAKDVIPVFDSQVYGGLATQFIDHARTWLEGEDHDSVWHRRTRVVDLCHEEFSVDERLDELSIDQVLQLRTVAWGKQAEARELLFKSVDEIAQDLGNSPEFEKHTRKLISEYRKVGENVVKERKQLDWKLKCDVLTGTLASIGTPTVAGLMSQVALPLSMYWTLTVGVLLWVVKSAKEQVPARQNLRSKEHEMKRGAGFGLHDFYSRIKP